MQLSGTSNSASNSADASVGPASVMVGNLVQGNRLAAAQGRDLGFSDDNKVFNRTNLFIHWNNFSFYSIN